MILSHKNKFIFIKPQKTAGTSVELFLSKFCGNTDIITPFIYDPNKNIRKDFGSTEPQNHIIKKLVFEFTFKDIYKVFRFFEYPKTIYTEHLNAFQIKKMCGVDLWNNYMKISIVRNPWDHAVSYYKWYLFRGHFKGTFKDFVKRGYNLQTDFLFINDEFICDTIIRFETLKKDVNKLINNLQLETNLTLPEAKKNIRDEGDDYRSYYDLETEDIVRSMNIKIIERFDYKF